MQKQITKAALPLTEYLKEANDAYPEGYLVENYFDLTTGKERRKPQNGGGDTLALFVGHEITSLYDETLTDAEQRAEFIRALESAQGDLDRVIRGLAVAS